MIHYRSRWRKLKKGEHRYESRSGNLVIYKPKNYKKWKSNKDFIGGYWRFKRFVIPPPEEKLWRFSYAINFPIHNKYFGALGQIWFTKQSKPHKKFIIDGLLNFLKDYLKFKPQEFWFDTMNSGEGWQEVEVEKRIKPNFYQLRIENNTGATVKIENGIFKHS